MAADFLTKPLQGSLFQKFRDVILGYQPVTSLNQVPTPVLERVEENSEREPIGTERITYADVAQGKCLDRDSNDSLINADMSNKLIRFSKEI